MTERQYKELLEFITKGFYDQEDRIMEKIDSRFNRIDSHLGISSKEENSDV